MLMKILWLVIGVVLAFLLIVISRQPSRFRVSRSMTLIASPEHVFEEVNDLHRWEAWSPWAKMDPQSTADYSGPASGPGAQMHWKGNRQVGEGVMTIQDSKPADHVTLRLEFMKPFTAVNTAELTFRRDGSQTVVTWSMWGPNTFVGKAIGLVMNCDKMIGDQFDKGLASLKDVVEANPK